MSQKIIDRANQLRDSGKTKESIKILTPLLKSRNYQIAANAHVSLGICYANEKKHEMAIKMYKKAIDICEKNKWGERIGGIARDLGIVYKNARQYNEAEKWLRVSLEIIKRYSDEGREKDASLGIGYSKLGLTYTDAKKPAKAKEAFKISERFLKASNHEYWKLIGSIDSAYFLFVSKKYKNAKKVLEKAIANAIYQEKEYKLLEAFILAGDVEKATRNTDGAKMFYNIASISLDKIFDSPELKKKFSAEIDKRLR